MTNELLGKNWRNTLSTLTDSQLLDRVQGCAEGERGETAGLVAHLAEVIRRDLALKRGFPSPFKYAREELKLSDSAAWERVAAARLALQLPETVGQIARGELTLSAAAELWKAIRESQKRSPSVEEKLERKTEAFVLQPELPSEPRPQAAQPASRPEPSFTMAEKRELLGQVLGKSRRESEAVIGRWKQERDPGSSEPRPPTRPAATCRARDPWTELGFFVSEEELSRWERLRDLLSHKLGSRDPNPAFLWMLEQGLDRLDPIRQEARAVKRREKKQQPQRQEQEWRPEASPAAVSPAPVAAEQEIPSPETVQTQTEKESPSLMRLSVARHVAPQQFRRQPIPAALRRAVWIRDQGKCRHRDPQSERECGATAYLDLDHIIPVSQGGGNSLEGLRLACAVHNRRRPFWSEADQPLRRAPTQAGEPQTPTL